MNERIDMMLKGHSAWLAVGADAGIVVSSRIRLARNVDNEIFPEWASDDDNTRMWRDLSEKLCSLNGFSDGPVFGMDALHRIDKDVLVERHIISRELAGKSAGSGVLVNNDESASLMINEEDHIRMQVMQPGLMLDKLWRRIDDIDSAAEQLVNYAFSPVLGYLTACPSNVGTGMRASVMMHLPGLVLMNEITPVVRGINKIGLAVRGLWGEGTDAAGNMFQISNQVTLGDTEANIIKRLEQVVLEVEEHEKNARERLMNKKENVFRDYVGRAIGILTHAHLLNSRETLDMLSALRFGIEMSLIKDWEKGVVDELFLSTQPGHLQKNSGQNIGADKRDAFRAMLVRDKLLSNQKN